MPVSSRRCGMITRREAERLCKSFLGDNAPPRLPDDFSFSVYHECAWGCRGQFLPSRYNSSRAKCIKCTYCSLFFSPNKFIFHSHRIGPGDKYVQPDAANFNSWRRHMKLSGVSPDEIVFAWEDVKAMFNGGTRKRLISSVSSSASRISSPNSVRSTAAQSSNHRNGIINTSSHSTAHQEPQPSPKRKLLNLFANYFRPFGWPIFVTNYKCRNKGIKHFRKSNTTIEPTIDAGRCCCCCGRRSKCGPSISHSTDECALIEAIKCKLFTADEFVITLSESGATQCHHNPNWYCSIDSIVAKFCHGLHVAATATPFR